MTVSAPLETHRDVIRPEWIDYNGHMNLAYYVWVFDYATDSFLEYIGLSESFRSENRASTFSAEIHVNYLRELREGDEVRLTTQLLGFDRKRIHFFHSMYETAGNVLAATNELVSLYMDMEQRRVAEMPEAISRRLDAVLDVHSTIPPPPQAGRSIGLPAK